MNITDLIEQFENIREDYGDDIEVRLASQPNWPFEWSIAGVVAVDHSEVGQYSDNEDDMEEVPEDAETVVYIAEGSQIGYLPEFVNTILKETGTWNSWR